MKISINLIFLFLLMVCGGCPEQGQITDSVITINNSSNESVIFYAISSVKNDTLLTSIPYPLTIENSDSVDAHGSNKFGGPYKKLLSENVDRVLMLFLFSRDVIEHVNWDVIESDYLILRRYDLTLDSLNKKDFAIIYP